MREIEIFLIEVNKRKEKGLKLDNTGAIQSLDPTFLKQTTEHNVCFCVHKGSSF